jgi:zinc transport system permease protein
MTEIMDQLTLYLQFSFVRYALIVGVLIALCSSLLGVTLVLKRYSFIGTGLSNVAFGSTAIAAAMSFSNNILLVLPVTIVSAIFLLRSGQNVKVKGDAALAMISVGSLAIGYLIMNVFSHSANLAGDICTVLFGSTSIMTLRDSEVWLSVALSILVVAVFLLFYHKIFAITFDEDFSTATGVRAKIYNLILSVVIAVVIVLAMNLVGALLISALVIFPAMSAMRVFKSFKAVTICSVIISVICTALGILISIVTETPVGATIVAVDIAGFGIFSVVGLITRRI